MTPVIDGNHFAVSPTPKVTLFDSHCHLHAEAFAADRDDVIAHAKNFGVQHLLLIGAGSGMASNHAAIACAQRYRGAFCSIGLHPHDAKQWNRAIADELTTLQKDHQPVAWGEIGLDYHYNFASKEEQWRCFEEQLAMAASFALPFIIHSREADEDMLRILTNHRAQIQKHGGIMHCFSGGPEAAERYLDLGMHLSYAGVITFPKATNVHEAVKVTPLDRLLLETDAPYLTPTPWRGKRNEPACVFYTAQRAAELKGVTLPELAAATFTNTHRLLNLQKS